MTYKDPILNERGKTHGDFMANAVLSQHLKDTIEQHTWSTLEVDQREALDMLCLKISRICTGNPNEPDHWRDIAGYANLIYERLNENKVVATTEGFFDSTGKKCTVNVT